MSNIIDRTLTQRFCVLVKKTGEHAYVEAETSEEAVKLIRERFCLDGRLALFARPVRKYVHNDKEKLYTVIVQTETQITVKASSLDDARDKARALLGKHPASRTRVTDIK